MKTNYLVSVSLISLTVAGVGLAGSPFSIGVPETAWETPTVHACWQSSRSRISRESGGWTKMNYHAEVPSVAFQGKFKSWVTSAYNRERVGLGFAGLGECPDDPKELSKYQVYLVNDMNLFSLLGFIFGGKTLGISDIGNRNRYVGKRAVKSLVMKPSKKYYGIYLPEWETTHVAYKGALGLDLPAGDKIIEGYMKRVSDGIEKEMGLDPLAPAPSAVQRLIRAEAAKQRELLKVDGNKFTVLHEVGHLVGLLHEDRRHDAEASRPKYCLNVSGDKDNENDGTFKKEVTFSTEYDPFSIMSYCRETMHRLFHQAKLVCRLAPKLGGKISPRVASFLKNCGEVSAMSFPVDLTPRDVNGLRQMYLKEAPRGAEWASFRVSAPEVRLFELLDDSAQLPFDPVMFKVMNTVTVK